MVTKKPNRTRVQNKRATRKKKQTLPQLKKKLWRIFSEYIRIKDSNSKGSIKCITCESVYHWKDPKGRMQCGHFFPKKGFPSLYYNETNTAPQCSYCNGVLEGAQYAYSLYIKERYGQEVLDSLYKKTIDYRKWKLQDPKKNV